MNLSMLKLFVVYLFCNCSNADTIKKSLLETVNITQNLKNPNVNEIIQSNQDNSGNNEDTYLRNETLFNIETTRTTSDPQTTDSAINSEYELLIEIFGNKNQSSTKNITTETPQEFVLMSQTKPKEDLTKNNVLQIVEILLQKNQSTSETSSSSDDVDFEIKTNDETSTESTTQSSTDRVLSQPTTSNEGSTLSGESNDLKKNYSKTLQHKRSVMSEDNTEASKNDAIDTDSRTFHPPIPKQQMHIDILKLPRITCDLDTVSEKNICVPRSVKMKDISKEYTILEKSSFSLPCPPGTGRAADNTCQSQA